MAMRSSVAQVIQAQRTGTGHRLRSRLCWQRLRRHRGRRTGTHLCWRADSITDRYGPITTVRRGRHRPVLPAAQLGPPGSHGGNRAFRAGSPPANQGVPAMTLRGTVSTTPSRRRRPFYGLRGGLAGLDAVADDGSRRRAGLAVPGARRRSSRGIGCGTGSALASGRCGLIGR